jgi:hypothetical protein
VSYLPLFDDTACRRRLARDDARIYNAIQRALRDLNACARPWGDVTRDRMDATARELNAIGDLLFRRHCGAARADV